MFVYCYCYSMIFFIIINTLNIKLRITYIRRYMELIKFLKKFVILFNNTNRFSCFQCRLRSTEVSTFASNILLQKKKNNYETGLE